MEGDRTCFNQLRCICKAVVSVVYVLFNAFWIHSIPCYIYSTFSVHHRRRLLSITLLSSICSRQSARNDLNLHSTPRRVANNAGYGIGAKNGLKSKNGEGKVVQMKPKERLKFGLPCLRCFW